MKNRVACIVTFIFLLGCSKHPVELESVLSSALSFDGEKMTVTGFLCVDMFTVYLSTNSRCDDIDSGRRIPLILEKGILEKVRQMENGKRVVVDGTFVSPPEDAIHMEKGVFLGGSIEKIESVKSLE